MSNIVNAKTLSNSDKLKTKFQDVLGENSKYFMQSVVNSFNNNPKLLECDGMSVWSAAMNAAILGLPIDNNLSYSAIVPYGKKAQFQIMIKGYIQLAIDTGLYKTIHVAEVFEDELSYNDPILGKTFFTDKIQWKQREKGQRNKIVGYYAFIELINGFKKEMYMTKNEVETHGKIYSKTFNFKGSVWKENFDAMGKKTVLKALLRTYGKLGKDTQKLAKALETDEGFIENLDNNEIKYYDNPAHQAPKETDEAIEVEIEVEDDFVEVADPLGKE